MQGLDSSASHIYPHFLKSEGAHMKKTKTAEPEPKPQPKEKFCFCYYHKVFEAVKKITENGEAMLEVHFRQVTRHALHQS
jgi:hypothetical protein